MIVNVIVSALMITVVCLFVSQVKPEFSFLIKLSGVCLILLFAVTFAKDKLADFYSYFSGISDISDVLRILIKAAAICIATSVTSSICKENGNTAIAQGVELFGRFAMFSICLPLIESIIKTALSFID
ncbi:MAG: SpoIIIAC/SpoIIIAD family protein [Acutalibacteraceae bacterium]